MESYWLMSVEFVLQNEELYKSFTRALQDRWWRWLHDNANVFITTELYT